MFSLFAIHVLLFSVFAIGMTSIPKPVRAWCFYSYLSIHLFIGGFLGNAYSLPVFDNIVVSGGNLAYAAFMMTSVLFVLAERDSFILQRIIVLVLAVNVFKVLLFLVVTRTIDAPGILNPHQTPSALFEASIPFVILGGTLIILELGIMLYVFELIKRFTQSPVLVRAAYLMTFVVVLCLDGIAFPLIAFGASEKIIGIVVGGFTGKLLTATSFSLAILAFSAAFPKRFAAYINESVFTWRTLLSTSSEIIRDLERKDEQLAKTETRIVQSAKLAGLGYGIFNRNTGQVVECDEVYAGLHGLTVEEITSLDKNSGIIGQLVHEDDRKKSEEFWEQVGKGDTLVSELRYVLPSGEIRSIRKIFSPLDPMGSDVEFFEVVGQDVTETRELQNQLFQSQKVDAIGKLTGGVAHDFNNLLAVTLSNLELLNDQVEDPEQKQLIKNSVDATIRGSDLTRNMLSFARRAPLEPTVVDLNQLVQNMQNWIERTLPSTIEVETSLFADLWETEVDPSSAESGLLNLILNARDAMPNGGKLTIETSNVTFDQDYTDMPGDVVEAGRYVLLSVSDTGEGISAEDSKNIFEPFFTTKDVGKGSGLGLAMLEGFMKQSRGTVHVDSEQGIGTTFKLYFRAITDAKIDLPTPSEPIPDSNAENQATILLVEDNADVLDVFQTTLTQNGYRVIQAGSGDEALNIFKENTDISLLLTDIVMPGDLQGIALAKELRQIRPDLPVIFMSGYSTETTVHGNGLRADEIHLMKPVRREDLLRAVNKALSPSG